MPQPRNDRVPPVRPVSGSAPLNLAEPAGAQQGASAPAATGSAGASSASPSSSASPAAQSSSLLRLGMARVAHFVLQDLGSRKSQISCQIAIISIPITTCFGSSALPTRLDRPSEFHGHRALFTDLAPARRGVISVFHVACSAGPCGPASPAAAARDFNTEFSRATFRVS
jgi:hypothetical protein